METLTGLHRAVTSLRPRRFPRCRRRPSRFRLLHSSPPQRDAKSPTAQNRCPSLTESLVTKMRHSAVQYNCSGCINRAPSRAHAHLARPQVFVVNPRRACAARVTVLGLSVRECVYSRTAGNEPASERYQQLQRNKRSKIKMAILLKQRRSRSRNWHYRGPRCVTQPIN